MDFGFQCSEISKQKQIVPEKWDSMGAEAHDSQKQSKDIIIARG
jgi:hypothetical protein